MRRIFGLFVGALAVLSTSCEKGALVTWAPTTRMRPTVASARDAVSTLLEEELLREIAEQEALSEARAGSAVQPGAEPALVVDSADRAEEALMGRASAERADPEETESDLDRLEEERRGAADDLPRLASIARETWIYAEPKPRARRVGYLRAGAVVPRSREPVGTQGCKGGWYRVAGTDTQGEPKGPRTGFVCLGRSASLNPFHPVVEALSRRPRLDGLPYDYVMSRIPGPPFYSRLPSRAEQEREEPDLAHHVKKVKGLERDPSFVPVPEGGATFDALLYGRPLPPLADDRPSDALVLGRAGIRSGFALVSHFEEDGRTFGVTTELRLLPLDRTRWIRPSAFQGLALDEQTPLPVGFVMKKKGVKRLTRDERGRMTPAGTASYREAIALTGRREGLYQEARDGTWIEAADLRVVGPMTRAPVWATEGKRWIDVSILEQSLVAYEGTRPVYVTLVSTGAGGIGDPKTTHATVQGAFLIHTKHVTTTMDGDETGDEFDLRDVPFVQYFHEGYALHTAYWHDDFGTPRSHGCVNLAPKDAAWLFQFTNPEVPAGWHGALSLRGGTVVYTHP